jgi:hypothetical protein
MQPTNSFPQPQTMLENGKQHTSEPLHKYQRAIAAIWIVIGVVAGCSAIYDFVKTLSIRGNATWLLAVMALVLAFGATCLVFGRALWVSSGRALGLGRTVSAAGCLILGLLFASNLSNGILRSQPLSLLGALLCGVGFWFCVVSLRLCRSYARVGARPEV